MTAKPSRRGKSSRKQRARAAGIRLVPLATLVERKSTISNRDIDDWLDVLTSCVNLLQRAKKTWPADGPARTFVYRRIYGAAVLAFEAVRKTDQETARRARPKGPPKLRLVSSSDDGPNGET